MYKRNTNKIITMWLIVITMSISYCAKSPYESLADKNNFTISTSASTVKLKSFVFEATKNTALSADVVTAINGDQISLQLFTGIDTTTLIPTLTFCSDDACLETKTADELEVNYKPRYRASDSSYYSCPAPTIDQEYDKTVGWFETAVTGNLCVKEDKSKIFLEPVTYVMSFASGKTLTYRVSSIFGDPNDSLMLSLNFLSDSNPSLTSNVNTTMVNPPTGTVTITLPFGTDLTTLKPSFTILGSKVNLGTAGGTLVTSSSTTIDFSNSVATPVDLFVSDLDGVGGDTFSISITTSTPFSSFNIESSINAGVSNTYTGIIDHTNKTVKFLTIFPTDNVSSVVPTISLTDNSITVSPSVTNVTNFLNTNTYTFTSSTGIAVNYTVTGSPAPNAGDLLITEVHYDVDTATGFEGGGGTTCTEAEDEFVEIYNNSASPIDLAGMSLQYGTSTSGNFNTDFIFPTFVLNAGEYGVIVSQDAGCYNATSLAGKKVLFDTAGWSYSATGATIALVVNNVNLSDGQTGPSIDSGSTIVIDYVGYGTAKIFQSSATTDCTNLSISRKGNTSNNQNDFGCGSSNGTPGWQPFNLSDVISKTSLTQVTVNFDSPPTSGTGANGSENTANYCITTNNAETTFGACTSAIAVTTATLSGNTVTLTTANQTPKAVYYLLVGNITRSTDNQSLTLIKASFTGYYFPDLIITEVHYDVDTATGFEGGAGTPCTEAEDEFVEIYNNTASPIDLVGMSLQYGTTGGNFNNDFTFPTFVLNAGEYGVLVSQDAGCYNSTSMAGKKVLFDTAAWSYAATGATIALVNNAVDLPDGQTGPFIDKGTTSVMDYVGYGSATIYQVGKATDCTNKSIARTLVNNTNNNLADFGCGIANGTPGRANP